MDERDDRIRRVRTKIIVTNLNSVIRLMLQFLKENNLTKTLEALEEESEVSLNAVDNLDPFQHAIKTGDWTSVLRTISSLTIHPRKLVDLYSQVI